MRLPRDAGELSLVDSFLGDDVSGFLAAKPVERVRREGRQSDVYRASFEHHDEEVRGEAFVNADTDDDGRQKLR